MAREAGIRFQQSAYNLGARNQVGGQVERQFVRDLLDVLDDTRLLWLPNLTDTATSVDRSRNGATITWSESLAAFDAARIRLGSGVAVPLNGTDEEGDTPDAVRHSFGDGAVDEPFSLVALIKPDVNNAAMSIVAKAGSASAEEWELELTSSGHPQLSLIDESASASIGRRDATAFGTGWGLLVTTYDGSRTSTGIRIYLNGTRVDDTDNAGGTYTAMENTAALVHIGARYTTKARFFDGSIALVAVAGTQLSPGDVWAINELVNGYFGLSL